MALFFWRRKRKLKKELGEARGYGNGNLAYVDGRMGTWMVLTAGMYKRQEGGMTEMDVREQEGHELSGGGGIIPRAEMGRQ